MKKIILSLSILLTSLAIFAQPFQVDEVPVNQNGIESMIIEQIDATAAGAGYVTYRVFANMVSGYGYQLTTGNALTGPMSITTTGTWFNDALGTRFGDATNSGLFGFSPNLIYDSYVTSGGSANDRIAVPYSENVAGYVAGTPVPTITTPGLDLSMFNTTSSTNDFVITDGSFAIDPAAVTGAAVGPNPSNVLLIGQFTTDGDFAFNLNIQTYNFTTATNLTTTGIVYPLPPNDDPTGVVVAPLNGATFNKDDVVAIGVHATDPDGTIAQVEFFVNGSSIGVDLTDNGQTNPTLPTHSISWTAVGAGAEIFAIVTDDLGAVDTTASINIIINDPCPITVSLTSPAAGTYDLNNITLTANASDCDEPITLVEFLVGGVVVGSDSDDSDGWSFVYTPSEGTVNISARATNSVSAVATSTPVSVTFGNAAPTVSISAPATPFDIEIGHDTTFVATATDADGSVVRVDFFINGSLVATDNNGGDGFSFDYSASGIGSYEIYARARDNSNATTNSDTAEFNVIAPVGGPAYIIESMEDFCTSSDVFCMPVTTTRPVADVIGYDIEVRYNSTDVTPTGVVVVAEDLIGDRDWTTYSYNLKGDTAILISLYLNSSAPQGTTFTGEGTVFCIEFSRNFTFGNEDQTTFDIPVISESYAGYVLDQSAISGTYSTIRETEFNGSLSFWADNSPIKYEAGVNLITDIYGDLNPSEIVNPDAAGNFVFDITNGTSITIDRDIDATTDVQVLVNGYDAFLASKVAVEDASFRPNVYQIIAMDVNRDGRVSAGDISQISQRAVAQLDEFAQDWVFVPLTTVLTNFSYRISANYPLADGIGYSRLHVPTVVDLIPLPIEDAATCPVIDDENYKGILLGDVDGGYAAIAEGPELKSAKIYTNELVVDLGTNSVFVNSESSIDAVDFQLVLNSQVNNVKVNSVNGLVTTSNLIGNELKVSSYATQKVNANDAIMVISIDPSLNIEDVTFKLSLVNGQPVSGKVIKTVSVPTAISLATASQLEVYPNPVSSELVVNAESDAVLSIYNAVGQKVIIKKVVKGLNTVYVNELGSGVYVVELASKNKVQQAKIIVE